MVYDMPPTQGGDSPRRSASAAWTGAAYIEQVGATWVVPSAGPPCFLDDELRDLNDVDGDPTNIFPDQAMFLDQMRRARPDRGLMMVPGSTAELRGSELRSVAHPFPTGADLRRQVRPPTSRSWRRSSRR